MKTTPNKMISTHLESYEKGLQLMYRGKNDQKGKVDTLKGKLTLTDYKRSQILDIDYKLY